MEGAVLSGKLTAQEIHQASQNPNQKASQSSGSKVLGRTSNQNQSNPSVVSA
jgi:15-cis-phytoene desaturase